MTFKILIDLSHYESVQKIPKNILPTNDYLFSFNSPGDDLGQITELRKYDMILMLDPKPKFRNEQLIKPFELKAIKTYVKEGGKLLISSGNRGDYNQTNSKGSLRVLYHLTGVVQFAYVMNFHLQPDLFHEKKTNIIIREFPDHPIFSHFSEDDYLVFGNSTYLTIHPEVQPEVLLSTPDDTWIHNYQSKGKEKLGVQPLLTINNYHGGLVVTLGCSSIFTTDTTNGIKAGSNDLFVKKLFNWMTHH